MPNVPELTRKQPARAAILLLILTAMVLQAPSLHAQVAAAVRYFNAGQQALADGDPYRAIEEFALALAENPSYFDAHFGMAEAYYRLDEYDQALASARAAAELRRNDSRLQNLEGRIQIGMGNVAEAGRIFDAILSRERHNVDALIGRAELAVAQGRTEEAARRYQEAIRLQPQERRALLALAVLYDYLDDSDRAEEYIRLAVRYHPENAVAQLLAAEHYLQRSRVVEAERHAQYALTISPTSTDALFTLAHIALIRADYNQVLARVEELLEIDRNDHRAWYLRGVSLEEFGDLDEALRSFRMALTVRPDEEIPRFAAEQALLDGTDVEDPRRKEFAQHHFVRARSLVDRNLFSQAFSSYRRGLQLDPYDRQARLGYAELYRLGGHRARYLQELRVLDDYGLGGRDTDDLIETYDSALAESVAVRWNVDQFSLARSRTRFELFVLETTVTSDYPQSDFLLSRRLRHALLAHEAIDVPNEPRRSESFAAAFRDARRRGSEYFLLTRFTQAERSFMVEVGVYVGRTGTEIANYRINRSGNDRIQRALAALAAEIDATLPLRGTVERRDAERVLINLGSLHGVAADDTLEVVRRGELLPRGDQAGFMYASSDVLGTVRISRVDDLVSEGVLSSRTVFDYVNVGDEVVREGADEPRVPALELFPPLYRRIRGIR